MRIAVPLLGSRIAPRLCFTREFLLVDADKGAIRAIRRVARKESRGLWEFVEWITEEGVGLILCCGLNREAWGAINSSGVNVLWGLTGEAEEVVSAYLDGRYESAMPLMQDWPGARRGPGCGGTGWSMGTSVITREEGEYRMPGGDGTGPRGGGPGTGRGRGPCGRGGKRGGGAGRGVGRGAGGRGGIRGRGQGGRSGRGDGGGGRTTNDGPRQDK